MLVEQGQWGKLIAKWRADQQTYPGTPIGIAVTAAVELCAQELEALLATAPPEQAEQSAPKLKCECQPIHSQSCVFRDVRSSQYRHFYAQELGQAVSAGALSARDERYYWPDGRLKWGCPIDVGHLIEQLKTLDPKMEVSSVTFVHLKDGTKARAYGLSMSRERWGDSLWLDYKMGGPEKLAIWATQRDESIEGLAPDALSAHDQKVRKSLSAWMVQNSFATGHGDTVEDLLKELKWQIEELRARPAQSARTSSTTTRKNLLRFARRHSMVLSELRLKELRQDINFKMAQGVTIAGVTFGDLLDTALNAMNGNLAAHDQKVRAEVLEEAAKYATEYNASLNETQCVIRGGLAWKEQTRGIFNVEDGIRALAAPAASKPASGEKL